MFEFGLLLILLSVTFIGSVLLTQSALRKRSILRMRSVREPPHLAVVRKGDMIDRENKETLKLQHEAEAYAAKGEILKAARTYIHAGMHRQAITVLEEAGEIERACQILFEMNRPNRAGALFERHNHFEAAGKSYLKAGLQSDAVRCLERAAQDNPDLFPIIAQIYKAQGATEKVLESYAQANLMDDYVRYAYREAAWVQLSNFMTDESRIQSIFQRLDYGMMRAFIRELPADQKTAQSLAHWSRSVKQLELVEIAVKKLSRNRELLTAYWSAMPVKYANQLAEKIAKHAESEGQDGAAFMLTNAASLYESARYNAAGILYAQGSRHLMAAKCHAHAGELQRTAESLKKASEPNLALAVEQIMRCLPQASSQDDGGVEWGEDARSQVLDLLENATPERDERERNSPFVMAS
jgi:tetratricopeptide (TPR) repeat protein